MDMNVIMKGILDSYPYPIVFVDDTYTIRFMNRYAEYHYYQERGYGPLLGKSLFDCHNTPAARERFVSVNTRNQRIYMQPVRDGEGKLIRFFERFELNLEVRR